MIYAYFSSTTRTKLIIYTTTLSSQSFAPFFLLSLSFFNLYLGNIQTNSSMFIQLNTNYRVVMMFMITITENIGLGAHVRPHLFCH